MLPPTPLNDAATAVASALSQAGIPFAFLGAFAVAIHGAPRFTADVDAIVDGSKMEVSELAAVLESTGLRGRLPDYVEFARRNYVFLMEHPLSGVQIDVSLAYSPFEVAAIGRAGTHASLPVLTVEDLVITKMVAFRPKDLIDVAALYKLHGFDKQRVLEQLVPFVDDPERPEFGMDAKRFLDSL